ncbi:MAG: hydrogenase expression/formation protein HypE [Thermodesulfobacteriota bacterium]|nr:hydrogenase expression/formation protein HypE [Thermodesulfobacteriota bacterium]
MKKDKILLDHGSGGKIAHSLIVDTILPLFDNPILSQLNDGAILDIEKKRLAFSTDTYVVDPIFFPGGNIGTLSINGTVNDVAMCGATPLFLSAGLIIEEGFPLSDLKTILEEMSIAAEKSEVKVVTGDTKVVTIGAVDKIFINTSGIGIIPENVNIASHRVRPGDKIILSGSIADHGITILTQREGIAFDSSVVSDTAPLNHMVKNMLSVCNDIHVLRDPTRGGIGTALNEIAIKSRVGIKIYEEKIPVKNEVSAICELLGFDPVYIANEGKLLAFVPPDHAEKVLDVIKQDKFGREACMIGEVVEDNSSTVFMQTRIGGTRIVDMLAGEQLPRIC